jgi:hypothetical protein
MDGDGSLERTISMGEGVIHFKLASININVGDDEEEDKRRRKMHWQVPCFLKDATFPSEQEDFLEILPLSHTFIGVPSITRLTSINFN